MKFKNYLLLLTLTCIIFFGGCTEDNPEHILNVSPTQRVLTPTAKVSAFPKNNTNTPDVVTPTSFAKTPDVTIVMTQTPKPHTPTPIISSTPTPSPTPTPTPTPKPYGLSDDEILNILNGESDIVGNINNASFKLYSNVYESFKADSERIDNSQSESYEYTIKQLSDTEFVAKVKTYNSETTRYGNNVTTSSFSEDAYYQDGYCYRTTGNQTKRWRCTFEEFMEVYLFSKISNTTLRKEQVLSIECTKQAGFDLYKVNIDPSFIKQLAGSGLPANSSLVSNVEILPGNIISRVASTIKGSETYVEYGTTVNYNITLMSEETILPFHDFNLPVYSDIIDMPGNLR